MSTPTEGVTWRVDAQVQRTKVNALGGLEDGFDISFTTGQGHNGSVFVPQARYNTANVKAAVAEAAALMDDVGRLTHDSAV
jgi:hypothetical protein